MVVTGVTEVREGVREVGICSEEITGDDYSGEIGVDSIKEVESKEGSGIGLRRGLG